MSCSDQIYELIAESGSIPTYDRDRGLLQVTSGIHVVDGNVQFDIKITKLLHCCTVLGF